MREDTQLDQAEPLIRFRNVQKTYDGETLIVRDLTIDVQRGEFLTLLGPSGSGKTTCLMMLAGFETPTSGEIRLDGKVINRVPPHQRNIGIVFQNYALFPHMTVADNLRFPLQARKRPKAEIEERVAGALAMVRMDTFGARYPQQLSGGQQQRIALARALVFEPKLVLMDEPLGALDKQLREHMQLEIRQIHERLGVTVVYVTHDQGEALTMSDRIAVFNHGVIQQCDAPATLYEEPANAFVASFIGENNALDGRVEVAADGRCRVRLDDGSCIEARAADVREVGSPAMLSIRPERVHLNGAAAGAENRLTAAVEELIYLGDHVRIRMQVANNANFIAKLPISEVHGHMKPGDRMTIGVKADHVRAFAAPVG
ncbi:MAG: ABC transporter ATP-binding protein [Rhodospirillales bacterium]|nr:ABC transporter ATP-binding protein [Rhodospirillales bacterium]